MNNPVDQIDLLAAAEARVVLAAMDLDTAFGVGNGVRSASEAQDDAIAERDALRALIDAAQTVVDEYEHRFGTGDGFFGPIDPAVMALRAALCTNAQGVNSND